VLPVRDFRLSPCGSSRAGHFSPACMFATAADSTPQIEAPTPQAPPADAGGDSDAALMQQAAHGVQDAFAALVRAHQQSLVNFFARMGASSDCEDLVQETFVRLYRYRQQYRVSARFTTFLYHLARNVWADRGRKILRIEKLNARYENELRAAGHAVPAEVGGRLDVEAALDQLSPKLREVIVLNIYQGLRYQDVADVLGIPLGTVKSRINLALAALKELLDEG